MRTAWTQEEMERLREIYPKNVMKDIMEHFPGRSAAAITTQAKKYGIKKIGKLLRTRRTYTETDLKTLAQLYPHHSTKHVADLLGVTEQAIYAQAGLLGLKKSEQYMKAELSRQAERLKETGKPFRRKPGDVPANKGKKMSPEVYEKVKKTFFKKGHLPHNTKHDGAERYRADTDGRIYCFVSVSLRKWVHRYKINWQKAHGEIPPGGIIRHKDGDTLNDQVDNLELTTRADNLRRNSGAVNLNDKYVAGLMSRNGRQINREMVNQLQQHPEILNVKRSQILLNRTIKQENDGK